MFGREQMLAGLSGFLNGNQIGNKGFQAQKQGQGLHLPISQLGIGSTLPSAADLIKRQTMTPPKLSELQEGAKETDKDKEDEKKDRVELSDEAENEIQQAIDQAIQQGVTQQVVVSKDGRFEVSIDMRVNDDGSYDMDLAVRFAESRGAALDYQAQGALPEPGSPPPPAHSGYHSMEARAERYTSFEQSLETRGFQASIFFEQSKSVAMKAEQAYGSETGGQYLSTARQVSQEFVLNVSIHGDDITKFNEVGEALTQFDDTGTLGGFLSAVEGVLNADSSNLGAFMEATQGLVDASKEHIAGKLDKFFTSMDEEYGSKLEKLGFAPDILNNMGQDVQKDLEHFFEVTNAVLGGLLDNKLIKSQNDSLETQTDALNEKLDELREERKEILRQVEPNAAEMEDSLPTVEELESLIVDYLDSSENTGKLVFESPIPEPAIEPIEIDTPAPKEVSVPAGEAESDPVVPDTGSVLPGFTRIF